MELIAHVKPSSSFLSHDFLEFIQLYKHVSTSRCIGVSKNGYLIEFHYDNGHIFRGAKLQRPPQELEVIHDLDGGCLLVLIYTKEQFFEVVKFASTELEVVFKWAQGPFHDIKVVQDPRKGFKNIRVYKSPKEFQTIDLVSKQPFNVVSSESVNQSLAKQQEKVLEAVSRAKEEVQDLSKTIDLAVTELEAHSSGVKASEADVLRGLFNNENLQQEQERLLLHTELRQWQNFLLLKIRNDGRKTVEGVTLQVLRHHGTFRTCRVPSSKIELGRLLSDQIAEGILREHFGLEEDEQSNSSLACDENAFFYVKDFCQQDFRSLLQLQFFAPSLCVQKLDARSQVDLMTDEEILLGRILLSSVKKCVQVTSVVGRPFELCAILQQKSSPYGESIFHTQDLVVVVFKRNSCSYRLNLHSERQSDMISFIHEIYQLLSLDVRITMEKELMESKVTKKAALLDELHALAENKVPNQVQTDRAFHT